MTGGLLDIGDLSELQHRLLRTAGVDRMLAFMAAPVIAEIAKEDFAAQRTAHGEAWAGYWTTKAGTAPTLRRKGDLMRLVTGYFARNHTICMPDLPNYARYCMPKLWWPKGMPDSWRAVLEELLPRAVEQVMGGARV